MIPDRSGRPGHRKLTFTHESQSPRRIRLRVPLTVMGMECTLLPEEVDLVMVGGGAGASWPAWPGRMQACSVALLEKSDRVGGGAAYSGGVIWAPMNHVMRRKQLADSLDEAMMYVANASHGRGDTAVQRAYVETIGPVLEYVEEQTGIKFICWPGQPDYYPSLPGPSSRGEPSCPIRLRSMDDCAMQRPSSRICARSATHRTWPWSRMSSAVLRGRSVTEAWVGGRALLARIVEDLPRARTPVRPERSRARARHRGAIGCAAWSPRSTAVAKPCEPVVGYSSTLEDSSGTLEMNHRYLPVPEVHPFTPPVNSGDGHIMGMQIGAATALMDQSQWDPTIQIPGETHDGEPLYLMFLEPLSRPHSMVVNRSGRRFANESSHFCFTDEWMRFDSRTRRYMNFPAYIVVDSQYRRKYGLAEGPPGGSGPDMDRSGRQPRGAGRSP